MWAAGGRLGSDTASLAFNGEGSPVCPYSSQGSQFSSQLPWKSQVWLLFLQKAIVQKDLKAQVWRCLPLKWPACQAGSPQYSTRFQVQIKQFQLNTVNLVQYRCQEGHWQPLVWRLPAWLLLCRLSLCSSVNHSIQEYLCFSDGYGKERVMVRLPFPRRMSSLSGIRKEIFPTPSQPSS